MRLWPYEKAQLAFCTCLHAFVRFLRVLLLTPEDPLGDDMGRMGGLLGAACLMSLFGSYPSLVYSSFELNYRAGLALEALQGLLMLL